MLEIRDLHQPFEKWLREQGILFVRARSDRESTIREGWPDFTLIRAGRALLIEFKTEKGKTSTAQDKCHAEIESSGTRVFVVRDMKTAIEVTTAWRDTIGEKPTTPTGRISTIRRWNGGVWEKDASGWHRRRTATPADDVLPQGLH